MTNEEIAKKIRDNIHDIEFLEILANELDPLGRFIPGEVYVKKNGDIRFFDGKNFIGGGLHSDYTCPKEVRGQASRNDIIAYAKKTGVEEIIEGIFYDYAKLLAKGQK